MSGTTTPTPTPPVSPAFGDASFEQVVVPGDPGYLATPLGSPWSFTAGAGVAANGSPYFGGQAVAPDGSQAAYLQNMGSISQAVAGFAAGTYTLSLQAAQRANNNQDFAVLIDGVQVGSYRPPIVGYTNIFTNYTTPGFTMAAGTHTITFQGLNTSGGDNTALIDLVAITSVSTPTPTPPAPVVGSVTVAPNTVTLQGGAAQQFQASVTGTNLTTAQQGVTWSVAPAGTIDASGNLTAPTGIPTAQALTVTAKSIQDPTVVGVANVTVAALVIQPGDGEGGDGTVKVSVPSRQKLANALADLKAAQEIIAAIEAGAGISDRSLRILREALA